MMQDGGGGMVYRETKPRAQAQGDSIQLLAVPFRFYLQVHF